MEKRNMLLLAGAAVVGFLYLRNRAGTVAPATVNAGTAAPVGNTATPAASTANTQTATGSEAAYATAPATGTGISAYADALAAATKRAEDQMKQFAAMLVSSPTELP